MTSISELLIAAIDSTLDGLKWVAVIVAGYIFLEWMSKDDNDPDGYS